MRFVHLPNHDRKLKGTKYIEQACFELIDEEDYDIDLKIIEDKPHKVALQAIKESDVVIDQLLIGWYGMAAVEAWVMRKPVICYIRTDLYEKYEVPVKFSTPQMIKCTIRHLASHPESCKLWGERGRKWVETVHDVRKMDLYE